MTNDGRKIALTAPRVVTVGELLADGAALGSAVSIGVNRPSYVAPALWRALGGEPTFTLDPARIWPAPAHRDAEPLAIAFRRHALALYPPDQRERRARRLVTALLPR